MSKDSSLTTPADRKSNVIETVDTSGRQLTDVETQQAMSALNQNAYIRAFPERETRFADPPIDLQKIGLFSFVPAKGARPNENGIYGFAKLRGNFESEEEANLKAEEIVRKVDSYHQIYHTYVGRPFPLTNSSDFSKDISRIDVRKEMTSSIAAEIKKKREQEQKEIDEIKAREKALLEDVAKEEEAVDDLYTTLKNKKAQLTWTYIETRKKLEQVITSIAKARKEIEDLDKKDPNLQNVFFDKYAEARKQAGLSMDMTNEQTFIRYMIEDVKLPEVEAEYEKLYGK